VARVLYFTAVPLDRADNGGALVCRNHVRRLSQSLSQDLIVCNAGRDHQREGTEVFANSLGTTLRYAQLEQRSSVTVHPRWAFFWETLASGQRQVDRVVMEIVDEIKPDVAIIDYLFSALFVPSLFTAPVRRVMITLNRELEFYREQRRLRGQPPDPSEQRLADFENWVYTACNAVVALTAADIPPIAAARSRVVPPLFDPAAHRWCYGGKTLLFVGNTNHHPNFLAVQWLATSLAPALEAVDREVKIEIIGAAADDMPPQWRRPNVSYLGVGDGALVTQKLNSCGLFVAPIANNFGSKIKLLDCLSHATPFAATEEALSGVRFLEGVPCIRLDQPRQAAELTSGLLQDGARLTALSQSLAAQLAAALKTQQYLWRDLIDDVVRQDLPPAAPRPELRPDEIISSRIGRNEPCPCGSGKRFKHCHGRQS